MRRVGVLAAIASLLLTLSPTTRAAEAVRSGTIVSGTGATGGTPGWGMEGCVGAPTCWAWYMSACDSRLAGQEPATMSAIVDIEDVVDAKPHRVLEVTDGAGLNWGSFRVQFWTETGHPGGQGYCKEIEGSRFNSRYCHHGRDVGYIRCEFVIPYWAKWMTITSSPDNTNIDWTLT